MEDMGDPFGELAQVLFRQVGHDRLHPCVLQPGPFALATTTRQPEDVVPGGQSSGNREADPTGRARHEHPPTRRA